MNTILSCLRGFRAIAVLVGLLVSQSAAFAACPCTLWPASAVPANPSENDPGAVELGVKFRADVAGVVTGIRFYKGAGNSGTHSGSLWSTSGTRLATATFANETASGWQQVNFASPVAISANTTYIASYYAPNGRYAGDNDFFAAQGVVNGPLSAPSDSAAGGNGVYAYGPQSGFPASTYRASNYWVDVVFETTSTPPPSGAAPILLVTAAANPFTSYFGEILRAEGLNAFASADINTVTPALLANYDVVLLGQMPLTQVQVDTLSAWVNGGGNLIASRPDAKLAGLLGLTALGTTLADQYLLVNTASGPGVGIVNQTIQFHDAADRYALNGATSIATLYSDASTATTNPAVTLRSVGAGRAAAFTYDLAKSVVYTRQGNPAWAGQERDGQIAIRPDDLFFPDYVNLDKVAIPQADEQQRLLANLIIQMNLGKKPLPRFWYLPGGLKAAIVHTLDDHNTASGTRDTFDKLLLNSAANCVVDDWKCLRATLWAFGNIALTDPQAATYQGQGFELGAHVDTGCTVNFTSFAQLDSFYASQLSAFRAKYPSVTPQTTHRVHCLVWSDWLTQARVQLSRGIRYNMDYYYWPGSWVAGRPGLFTGSGLPMRFADTDGSTIDIYQGVSQLVNENGLSYPTATNALLDKALGPEGYYGLFGTHDDYSGGPGFLDALLSAAVSRNVPIISAKQALTWLDGRNGSSFDNFGWSGNTLSFSVTVGSGARNLQAMLPATNATNALSALTRGGVAVSYSLQTIKGISYAVFAAAAGSHQATYAGALPPPPNPPGEFTLWPSSAVPANPSENDPGPVELGVKFTADRDGLIAGIRFYKSAANSGTHIGNLWSSSGALLATAVFNNETASGWQQVNFATPVAITANTTYVASYHTETGFYAGDNHYFDVGLDTPPLRAPANTAAGGNGVYVYGASAFPNETYLASNYWVDPVFKDKPADATLWPATTLPGNPAFNDPMAIEVGVKFTANVDGKVKGIRFYKGATNTGTHIGNLWTAAGAPLASATFANETATGWQQVLFATPVDITAGTTYVASYFAPNGNYAVDINYFAGSYVNGPLTAPSSAASGGNGLYRYGPTGFPQSSFNAANYWVDVVFERK